MSLHHNNLVCVWVEGYKRMFEANVWLQKHHHPYFYFQRTFIRWICIEPCAPHFQLKSKHTLSYYGEDSWTVLYPKETKCLTYPHVPLRNQFEKSIFVLDYASSNVKKHFGGLRFSISNSDSKHFYLSISVRSSPTCMIPA